ALLAGLEQGGFYERLLALQACYGSRDGAVAVRALEAPSRILRGRALRAVALFADDEQVRGALQAARPGQRPPLLPPLARRRRWGPIDAFLDGLAARDDPDLGLLLPYGSAKAAARHLDQARRRGGQLFWSRLARHHPDLAARALRDEAR